jgi:hypothetical protein
VRITDSEAAKVYCSDAEVEHLVAAFRNQSLPRPGWTHHAHLTVALWFLRRYSDEEALPLVREGIQSYNRAWGVPTTPTGGYHETLTRFYLWLVRRFLTETPESLPLYELTNRLMATYGDKALPLQYYSKERLMSPEARFGWLEPDLKPL